MANKLVTVTQLDTAVDGFASAVAAAGYEEKANLKKLAYEDDVTIDVMTTDLKTLLDGKMTQAKAQELVDQNVGKAYKPGGSKTLATLPALTEANFGYVYHMTEDFVTTDDFIEGLGKSYTAGAEVAIVEIPGANEGDPVTYKYNVLSSYIDTTKFASQSSFSVVQAAVQNIAIATNSDIQNLIDGMSLDEETVLAAGTYDANGDLLKSWDQLIADGDVIVTNGEMSTPDNRTTRFANVEKIVIDPSVTSIGEYTFEYFPELTTITIPDGVTSIGDFAFRGCVNLAAITIPDSVTSIGADAFGECANLTTITIPDSVTSIGEYAFEACTNLTAINIPDGVTSIGMVTFYGCSSLTTITIPDSVTSIGNDAFGECTNLTTIHYSGTAAGAPWGAPNATVVA